MAHRQRRPPRNLHAPVGDYLTPFGLLFTDAPGFAAEAAGWIADGEAYAREHVIRCSACSGRGVTVELGQITAKIAIPFLFCAACATRVASDGITAVELAPAFRECLNLTFDMLRNATGSDTTKRSPKC